jgi:hypothetical protein
MSRYEAYQSVKRPTPAAARSDGGGVLGSFKALGTWELDFSKRGTQRAITSASKPF